MTNWLKPDVTSLYTEVFTKLKANRDAQITMFATDIPTGVPNKSLKINRTGNCFEQYNSTASAWQNFNIFTVSTKAALKTISPKTNQIVRLSGQNTFNDGGEGTFFWNPTNLATKVGPFPWRYIAPNSATSGASGAWERIAAKDARKDAWSFVSSITSYNTAFGYSALEQNTTGTYNIAIGKGALSKNTVANYSVAIGVDALANYTATGSEENTAVGSVALKRVTKGNNNTAFGSDCLAFTTTGNNNTAIGQYSGLANTIGLQNTFLGSHSGENNLSGDNNTYVGYRAGVNNYPTHSGDNNTYVGTDTSPTATQTNLSGVTCLGYRAKVTRSNQMILGGTIAQLGVHIKIGAGTDDPETKMHIQGTQNVLHSTPNMLGLLSVRDDSATVQRVGGAITFEGYVSATGIRAFAGIKAEKRNATANDGSGNLDFYTSATGGILSKKIVLTDQGDLFMYLAGRGVVLWNSAGTIKQRITLTATGGALVFTTVTAVY